MRASWVLVALLVAAAIVFAVVAASTGDRFYLRLATEALIFAGLALSVDILLGYTGAPVPRPGALFRARRLRLRARPQRYGVLLAGHGGRVRCRQRGRSRGRSHRQPCPWRLLRPDHVRLGSGGGEGRLQRERSRRIRRIARRSGDRGAPGPGADIRRRRLWLLPVHAGLHRAPVRGHGLLPRYRLRPGAHCAEGQGGTATLPRLFDLQGAACRLPRRRHRRDPERGPLSHAPRASSRPSSCSSAFPAMR